MTIGTIGAIVTIETLSFFDLGENIIRVCDYSYKPACEFESLSVAES